jgi:hypothetical protein
MLFVVDALLLGKGIVTCHVRSQGLPNQLVYDISPGNR